MKENIIIKIQPQDNYIIICEFKNKMKKKYDVKPLIKRNIYFKQLEKDKNLFFKVRVDNGGYGISWNEEIDLAAEEIWENGEDVLLENL